MLKNSEFDACIVQWLDEYAPRGYIITDAGLVIRGWSRWLEYNSGLTADSVVGRHLMEVFPDLVSRQLDRLYQDALHGQVSILAQRFHKYLLKFKVGLESGFEDMQQSAMISPLIRDGNVIGTITVIEDVTERIGRENDLLAAREAANRANDAKDRFIAVLSHDLRTPLTAILGWSRLFREHPKDERLVLKGADVIERNAALQLALLEKILDISRINAAKLELDIEVVDVAEAVHAAVDTLEPLAQSKGIRIEQAMMLDKGRTAGLDPKRFQQIIWNLISNALKFTPQGGTVCVRLEYTPDAFQLSVADTGKGISAESIPHLFEPLWQDEGSGGHGGLGLGLAIVRNLVQLHGGSIRAESAGLGQGAVFIVQIPWSQIDRIDSPLQSRVS